MAAELEPVRAAVTVTREVLRWRKVETAVKSCVSSRTVSSSGCRPSMGTEVVTMGGAAQPLCRRPGRSDLERGRCSRSLVTPDQGGLIAR